jgi:hypothetical protein
MQFKKYVPWWGKIILKIILSRLPFSYQFWGQKAGLFKLGHMLNPEYAWKIFELHYKKTKTYLPNRFIVCELGPGDSLATAMISACFGSTYTYLIDIGHFATHNNKFYSKLAVFLSEKQLSGYVYSPNFSLVELLKNNRTQYLTNGLLSLKSLPSNSVDFIFSHAVLEHIKLNDFNDTIEELYRIQKIGGIGSHYIDLKDHLGGKLNNLRFSNKIWESVFFSSSGFYTNRLRAIDIKNAIEKAGFKIIDQQETCWDKIPLKANKLNTKFSNYREIDLLTHEIYIIHKK